VLSSGKGMPCKPATVPAAVSPLRSFAETNHCNAHRYGKVSANMDESENLPDEKTENAFGGKAMKQIS
jgi:hypothetical protein